MEKIEKKKIDGYETAIFLKAEKKIYWQLNQLSNIFN